MAKKDSDTQWHAAKLVLQARKYLETGGTLEELWDIGTRAAVEEWHCRVVFERPAQFVIDWPTE